jgi:hypothetical protein
VECRTVEVLVGVATGAAVLVAAGSVGVVVLVSAGGAVAAGASGVVGGTAWANNGVDERARTAAIAVRPERCMVRW